MASHSGVCIPFYYVYIQRNVYVYVGMFLFMDFIYFSLMGCFLSFSYIIIMHNGEIHFYIFVNAHDIAINVYFQIRCSVHGLEFLKCFKINYRLTYISFFSKIFLGNIGNIMNSLFYSRDILLRGMKFIFSGIAILLNTKLKLGFHVE